MLRIAAAREHADDVLGDLEEAHQHHRQRHGAVVAHLRTAIETIDMTAALVRTRVDLFGIYKGSATLQDYKLGLRMLLKYPGLTIAGGLAIAIAIGIGAAWYDLSGDLFRPRLSLPNSDRIVEVEMRDALSTDEERRLLHDFSIWRRDARSVEQLGAYRTLQLNLVLGSSLPEPVTVAETSASMFRVASVPPLHGRPLLDADERAGAPPVVVLGYDLWRRRFGAGPEVIGRTVQIGRTPMTVVGVMPKGFAFPINHEAWVPLALKPAGYGPLEGAEIRVFALVARGSTQAQANVELAALTDRVRAASPKTHEHLRPRVLAHGGESPGDVSVLEFVIRHLPILLVLLIACTNVGTLLYARTATRSAEIAMRSALGATRRRIIGQLFVEALVLASVAAVVGLVAANAALKLGLDAYYSSQRGTIPFWVDPGLKLKTVVFSAGLTVFGAALLGILPALKATRSNAQVLLRNLGSGASTLRFGKIWTTAMVVQVALTVLCIPPATGISSESWRDRVIRGKFPGDRYLAVRIDVERDAASARVEQTYRELQRRVAQEPGVTAVTFGDRLPGMGVALRDVHVELSAGAAPLHVDTMWTAAVGEGYFEAFDVPLVAGRHFQSGDRAADARTVLVNEAFARRYLNGATPIGRRVRYGSADPARPNPWLEIVGMVRDVGMTPTDLGEAPYVFRAVSPTTAYPLVMGIRVASDATSLGQRVRFIAAEVDRGLRLAEIATLDDLAWRQDLPQAVIAAALAGIVVLGLFMSAAGIFSLMSVSVARRTREIGLRAALGASTTRLLGGIFAQAIVLIGSGVAAGNGIILLFIALSPEVELAFVWQGLVWTSAVMLTVGLLACVEPARRALRIQPTDALRDV